VISSPGARVGLALCISLSGLVTGEALAAAAKGKGKSKAAGTTICDKTYKIVAPDGETELGTYRLRAVEVKGTRRVEIVESLAMSYRGKDVSLTSTVVYAPGPSPSPLKGEAETRIAGKPCMRGEITLSEKAVSYSGVGLLDKRTGQAITPPRKFRRQGIPRPAGPMIFQSAFPVLSPRFIDSPGELRDVAFVEFPDDIDAPELVNVKEKFRLVREKPDEQGRYRVSIYNPHREKPVHSALFDRTDRLVSISSLGKLRLVEAEGERRRD
jgi:hypothetical protein